ncbi:MAG: hypothetical protein FRX49_08788 [Trebouxia sp. A1-2]|nr:MAG: hypothetical protein FRX49_08788 [Trebouxia sp. A1-2]
MPSSEETRPRRHCRLPSEASQLRPNLWDAMLWHNAKDVLQAAAMIIGGGNADWLAGLPAGSAAQETVLLSRPQDHTVVQANIHHPCQTALIASSKNCRAEDEGTVVSADAT